MLDAGEAQLLLVADVGPVVARAILQFLENPLNRELIAQLRALGLTWTETQPDKIGMPLQGMAFVLTGTLPTLPRDAAAALIEAAGGKVAGSVSKKTSYVVAGSDAGSKLVKAQDLGIPIIDEQQLQRLLEESKPT